MKNSFGNNVILTLFGESHGPEIGCVIDGLRPGLRVEEEAIAYQLALRRPALSRTPSALSAGSIGGEAPGRRCVF